jgi:hypothetical protein
MEEENIKAYGYKNYITLKSKKRNKKNRRNRSEKKLKGTNSYKCCSFCCPKFSIRCENKRQISYVINYENDECNL